MSENTKNHEAFENDEIEALSYDGAVTLPFYRAIKRQLRVSDRMSVSGITNFVVNYEDPALIDIFLDHIYTPKELYRATNKIDVAQLAYAPRYLDDLIFGSFTLAINSETGVNEKNRDGFVNREEHDCQIPQDRYLIIRNIDSIAYNDYFRILNRFRSPLVKLGCSIILVTDLALSLPFPFFKIFLPAIDKDVSNIIIKSFVQVCRNCGYEVIVTEQDCESMHQIIIANGATYTVAAQLISKVCVNYILTQPPENKKVIDFSDIVKNFEKYALMQ